MIKIKNKEHSINLINQMGLNCMPQEVIDKKNVEKLKRFLHNNPAEEYIIRNIFTPMGTYKFVKTYEECIEYITSLNADKFSISVSFRNLEGRILLGDIYVKDNFVSLSASTSKDATHRNIYNRPEISLSTELYDDKLWDVPGFEKLIDYINNHNLYGIVVEFAIFRNKVGTQNENIVIIELRSDY